MIKYTKILSFTLIAALGLYLTGCSNNDTTDTNPLVGTWDMSNMEQMVTIATADASLGYPVGTVLGADTLTWSVLNGYFGVNASAELFNDGTYNLTGDFPVASDTLGGNLTVTPLSDAGTWTAASDLSTLLLEGSIYVIPPSGTAGPITVDNVDAPTTIDMTYDDSSVDSLYVYVATYGIYLKTALQVSSTTTLGFTKQ